MFRRRSNHEDFIGGYDPEHEMPDPDRGRGGRYQSDSYRNNAEDSRFAYRWNPDRFEDRFSEDRGRSYSGATPGRDEDRWGHDYRGRDRESGRNLYEMDDMDRTPMSWNSNMGRSGRFDRWGRDNQNDQYGGGYDRNSNADRYRSSNRWSSGSDFNRSDIDRGSYDRGNSWQGRDTWGDRDRSYGSSSYDRGSYGGSSYDRDRNMNDRGRSMSDRDWASQDRDRWELNQGRWDKDDRNEGRFGSRWGGSSDRWSRDNSDREDRDRWDRDDDWPSGRSRR